MEVLKVLRKNYTVLMAGWPLAIFIFTEEGPGFEPGVSLGALIS